MLLVLRRKMQLKYIFKHFFLSQKCGRRSIKQILDDFTKTKLIFL